MNSMFNCSRLVAGVALGAVLLVGCDSIKDVRSEPFTPIPAQKDLIAGTILGLGSLRPVFLSFNGEKNCRQPSSANSTIIESVYCTFFGTFNQNESEFSFGSLDVGTPYFIEVVGTQPYGKNCTVNNGIAPDGNPATPTNPRIVGDGNAAPVVICTPLPEPGFQRFDVTVNTGPLAVLPNAKLTLSTEDGIRELPGDQASVTFQDAIFDSTTSAPRFQYQLYATFTDDSSGEDRISYCSFTAVTSGQNTLTAGGTNLNASSTVVVPVGNVTANVATCTFTPIVTVAYSARPGETALTTMPTGGVTLGLRNHFSGVIEQTLPLAAGTAFSTSTTRSFPDPVVGNDHSVYEIVVLVPGPTDSMKCVVGGTTSGLSSMVTTGTPPAQTVVMGATGAAVLAINPANPQWWTSTARAVTCRVKETNTTKLLVGTYQRDRALQTASQLAANPPTVPARSREFLTFFDDGTFLWGINHTPANQTTCPNPFRVATSSTNSTLVNQFPSCFSTANPPVVRNPGEAGPTSGPPSGNYNAASGVNHGFYDYNPTTDTIVFTLTTASNVFPAYMGLNGAPGYVASTATLPPSSLPLPPQWPQQTGAVTATNVVKTAATMTEGGKISLSFGPATRPLPRPGVVGTGPNPGNPVTSAHPGSLQTLTWNMTEPRSIPGEISGAWSTADHTRVFVYDKNTYFGFHMGITGLPTLQDACFLITDLSSQVEGQLVRHSGFSATCSPGGTAVYRDVPYFDASAPITMPRMPLGYHGKFPGSASQLDGRPTSASNFLVTPGVGGADTLTVTPTSNGVLIPNQPAIVWAREGANAPVP